MSDEPGTPAGTGRHTTIGSQSRLALIGLALAAVAGPLAYLRGGNSPDAVTPARIVDRFEEVDGLHAGFRRNHAKGLGVSGSFESNGNGARLSRATVFKPGRVSVIGLFSLDGGQPYQHDRPGTRHSLGLQFSLPDGEQWRTAMIDFPLFPVRTPEIFYERLLAFAQDPATGKPDPAKVKAFEERHPETVEVLKKITTEPLVGIWEHHLQRAEYVSFYERGGQDDSGALAPETGPTVRGRGRRHSEQDLSIH